MFWQFVMSGCLTYAILNNDGELCVSDGCIIGQDDIV